MVIAVEQAWPHGDHDWIRSGGFRHPLIGEHCCGEYDCRVVPAFMVRYDAAGRAWLIEWASWTEQVPERETLRSRDGRFWSCHTPDGRTRCFFAPAGTS